MTQMDSLALAASFSGVWGASSPRRRGGERWEVRRRVSAQSFEFLRGKGRRLSPCEGEAKCRRSLPQQSIAGRSARPAPRVTDTRNGLCHGASRDAVVAGPLPSMHRQAGRSVEPRAQLRPR
eukprot:scaffold3673_cov393-Prasinococcus_capsulatus_cf.AAC.9